jgi:hypothetical protein
VERKMNQKSGRQGRRCKSGRQGRRRTGETRNILVVPKPVTDAIEALLAEIDHDESRSGGLLQGGTHLRAGELRVALLAHRQASARAKAQHD